MVDDPTAKQRVVQYRAGAYAGAKKYGDAANLPESASRGAGKFGKRGGGSSRGASRVHKPHLDEMHGPESLPYRPSRKPASDDTAPASGSRIFQPTDSRQSGPEFGPSPRSTGGAPGHRGGWKKRP